MKNWLNVIAVLLSMSVVLNAQTVTDDINLILQADPVETSLVEVVLQAPDAEVAVADDTGWAETVVVETPETDVFSDIEAALAEEPERVADDTVLVETFVDEEADVEMMDDFSLLPQADSLVVERAVDADQEIRVSMAFDDAPLSDVVRAFREASNANIISGWTNGTTRLVTMRLDNVPWKQGLTSILRPYDLEVKEDPRGSSIYVITERIALQIQRYTQTFELNHARAESVSELFTSVLMKDSFVKAFPSANAVIVKATEEELLECEEILKALDKPARQVYIEARFVRLSSSASKQLGMKWDSLSDWGVTLENMSAGFERNRGTMASYDSKTYEVEESASIFPGTGSWSRNKEGEREFIDPVYRNEARSIGVFPDKILGAPNAGRQAESMGWRKASGYGGQLSVDQFRLAISAFEQMDGAQVFSNPKIIVQNETKATVDMTTKEPNVQMEVKYGTQDSPGDKITSTLKEIPGKNESWVGEAFFSYGITLEVTPRISPTGLITVEIAPSISDLNQARGDLGYPGYRMMSDGNRYPIIRMQRLDTTFTMADGRTAVIGGLTETTEANVDSGIPLLRSIPWIGPRLFGWKSREKTQYEIIVFVTVGIIDGMTIEEDAGMPKNAVLGRGLFDGSIKEPGDRTDNEMFNLEQKPPRGYRIK